MQTAATDAVQSRGLLVAESANGVNTPVPIVVDVGHSLAMAVVQSSTAPLLLLDGELTVIAASTSFCRSFALELGTVIGCPFVRLGAGEWAVPQLQSLLSATVAGLAEVTAYEMDLHRPGVANRRLVLNAQKLAYADASRTRLLSAVADVTEARIAEKMKDELLREKAVLIKEIQHRIANSLQIIASILMQSAEKVSSEEARGYLQSAHDRVLSIASVQRQLALSGEADVGLRPYFSQLCKSLGASHPSRRQGSGRLLSRRLSNNSLRRST